MRPTFDGRDSEIRKERIAALDAVNGPRCGDYIVFSDDVMRRVSYIWDWDDCADRSIQTADSGSFYLGHGYVSFSGSLFRGIPESTLTRVEGPIGIRDGHVWFFHRDYWQAHCGVDTTIPFRVYRCSLPGKDL